MLRALSLGRRSLSPSRPALNLDLEAAPPNREHVFFRDSDLTCKKKELERQQWTWLNTLSLSYLSLGVIYGDISTSVIYVADIVFHRGGGMLDPDSAATEGFQHDVLGVFSLIFWTLTLIALLKYSLVVMRASDSGEGGTIALYAHLCRTMGISPFGTMKPQTHRLVLAMKSGGLGHQSMKRDKALGRQARPLLKPQPPLFRSFRAPFRVLVLDGRHIARWFRRCKVAQHVLLLLTMVSTGLALGDAVVMPAFTVVVTVDVLSKYISTGSLVAVSLSILIVLFLLQHLGSRRLSALSPPVIITWLLANTCIGMYNLTQNGGAIFKSLSPHWMFSLYIKYKNSESGHPFQLLGGAMLCVAGAENMFAAMGHFSPTSVSLAFGLFVYPCLVISYLGQGAYLMKHPGYGVFWASIPSPLFWPMVALAILTAIVACQSVVTSTFSLIRQATALGIFPKLKVIHTHSLIEGRIFIPFINYALLTCCILVVLGFHYSTGPLDLADAYGVAVMAVMLSTSFMLLLTSLVIWEISLLIIIPLFVFYATIESLLLASNLSQVPNGAWVPVVLAALFSSVMFVWWSGAARRRQVLITSSKQAHAATLIRVCEGLDPRHPLRNTLLPSLSNLTPEQAQLAASSSMLLGLEHAALGLPPLSDPLWQDMSTRAGSEVGPTGADRSVRGGRAMDHSAHAARLYYELLMKEAGAAAAADVTANIHGGCSSPTGRSGAGAGQPLSPPPSPVRAGASAEALLHRPCCSSSAAQPGEAATSSRLQRSSTGHGSIELPPLPLGPIPRTSPGHHGSIELPPLPLGHAPRTSPGYGSTELPPLPLGPAPRTSPGYGSTELPPLPLGHAPRTSPGYGSTELPPLPLGHAPHASPFSCSASGAAAFTEESAVTGLPVAQAAHTDYVALEGRPDKPLARASGLGLYYGESPVGMPLVMRHFLKNVDAIHEVCIILIVRFLPMPIVRSTERLLVRPVKNMPNFYQVVARYGYQDKVDHGDSFVSKLISTIMFKLEIKAGFKTQYIEEDFIHELEGDELEEHRESCTMKQDDETVFGLAIIRESYLGEETKAQEEMAKWAAEQTFSPFISRYALECLSRLRIVAGAHDATQAAKDALAAAQALLDTASTQVVHYRARTFTRPSETGGAGGVLHRLYSSTLGTMYSLMEQMAFSDTHAWHIPPDATVELGITVEI